MRPGTQAQRSHTSTIAQAQRRPRRSNPAATAQAHHNHTTTAARTQAGTSARIQSQRSTAQP
eukprot:644586-Alexandrium_andersonii.AAC.1